MVAVLCLTMVSFSLLPGKAEAAHYLIPAGNGLGEPLNVYHFNIYAVYLELYASDRLGHYLRPQLSSRSDRRWYCELR
jgi:hypothetical protein